MFHFYRVHGLVLASEFDLPELARRITGEQPPDVVVRLASVPIDGQAIPTTLPGLRTIDGSALFEVENVGRYLVKEGREVFIDIRDGADPAVVRLFLFGSVMGTICHQRGLLALHASAVSLGDRVVAFTGPPGAGKSTMAAYCLAVAGGGRLMADDIAVVSFRGPGDVVANPGMPSVKLWRDTLANLGHGSDDLVRDWFRADKFHVPADPATEPLPLACLYVLESDDAAGPARFTRLAGALAADAIIANTYRIEYIDAVGRRETHFRQCALLAQTTKVVRLARSRSPDHLPATAALVLAELDKRLGGVRNGGATG